jgi:hypothetical protein
MYPADKLVKDTCSLKLNFPKSKHFCENNLIYKYRSACHKVECCLVHFIARPFFTHQLSQWVTLFTLSKDKAHGGRDRLTGDAYFYINLSRKLCLSCSPLYVCFLIFWDCLVVLTPWLLYTVRWMTCGSVWRYLEGSMCMKMAR